MMQCCLRYSSFKIIPVSLVKQYKCHTDSTERKTTLQKQHDEGLICSEWEEAIIKEQRNADISFDSMQKETVDQLHNNSNGENNKQQATSNRLMHLVKHK